VSAHDVHFIRLAFVTHDKHPVDPDFIRFVHKKHEPVINVEIESHVVHPPAVQVKQLLEHARQEEPPK
jgi:hypothetical protein